MIKKEVTLDSRLLRAAGKVHGIRPQVSLRQTSFNINPPSIELAPIAPVDAVLIFGMGPVHLSIVKRFLHHDMVSLGRSRMKHNAIAALEFTAHGFVNKKGLIIPSGTATANPELMEIVSKLKHTNKNNLDALMAKLELQTEKNSPNDEVAEPLINPPILNKKINDETERLYTTSEAEIMEWIFLNAHSKVMRADGKGRITGKSTHMEIFRENQATETIENLIYAINELDSRSRTAHRKLFTGSIAAITSKYHIVRVMEIARYLGIENQVVPLVSQELLRAFEYDPMLFSSGKAFDLVTRWNEVKWIRAIYQIPENFLPVLSLIHDDERLVNVLDNLKGIYGEELLKTFGLSNITIENVATLRSKLKSIVRKNPKGKEWMKIDIKVINQAITEYNMFTHEWLLVNMIVAKTNRYS